jgi:hypothetical protein
VHKTLGGISGKNCVKNKRKSIFLFDGFKLFLFLNLAFTNNFSWEKFLEKENLISGSLKFVEKSKFE